MDHSLEVAGILVKIKKESFNEGYHASDAEAFGLLMSRYFEWDGRIVEACAFACEDANFHPEAATLRERVTV